MTALLMFLVGTLAVGGILLTLIGILTLFHLAKGNKLPMDKSNRINHIRLWWFVLTRPELFVNTFPWLKNDEYDNINNKK